jgi:hypothetical protein
MRGKTTIRIGASIGILDEGPDLRRVPRRYHQGVLLGICRGEQSAPGCSAGDDLDLPMDSRSATVSGKPFTSDPDICTISQRRTIRLVTVKLMAAPILLALDR